MTQSKNRKLAPFSREEFLTPFDALFDNVIQKAFPSFGQEFGVEFFGNNSYPKVDVIDHSDKITIEAEIPGLGREQVSVDLEEDVLTISGLKHSRDEDTNLKYIRKELKRSSFKRSFKLGDNVDKENIGADFENGLLLITISKIKKDQPKKVKIL